MLDRSAIALLKPMLEATARRLQRTGVSANQVTLGGFAIGMAAALLIAQGHFLWGAGAIVVSRLCDGLDGALARLTQPTDAGGFLDITLDFLFYATIPLAFAFADPARNALAAATLLMAFIGTMASFLAFAALAAKRGITSIAYPNKSFYFLGGLTEASETLAFLLAMCIWPHHFAVLAWVFAALCALTTVTRIVTGWRMLLRPDEARNADERH